MKSHESSLLESMGKEITTLYREQRYIVLVIQDLTQEIRSSELSAV